MRYSNRQTNGLPATQEIVVKSLSEFIKVISVNNFDDYIFRGENTNYPNTISSALREMPTGFHKGNEGYPFIQMKNEFKREIFHRLSPDERNDFLAFAQHHGIPTNLVDFSYSPLVALFFACQPFTANGRNLDENRGFVYLLENDLIDITHLLTKTEDENLLNLFIRNTDNILMDFYKKFYDFAKKYPNKFYRYFKTLADDYKYYFLDMQPLKPKRSRFPAYNNGEYESKLLYKNISENKDFIGQIEKHCGQVDFCVLEYTLMLQSFLKRVLDFEATVWWLNCIPNFIYSPILSFERGRNQKGLFVYQAYISFVEGTYNTRVVSQQRIWPEKIIVVENKSKILKELDAIDINDKFIYDDYDTIAKYIKRKYDKTTGLF